MSDDWSIKKKILLDLVITPMTMIPGMVGVTCLMGGWAIGSSVVSFTGLLGVLVAAGAAGWNFIFNLNEAVERSDRNAQTRKLMEEQSKLDALDKKLVKNKDPRDQSYLRSLRTIHSGFVEDIREGKLSKFVTSKMIQEVNNMFDNYVGLLEYSYEIWERSRTMDGAVKDRIIQQREEILAEVEENVAAFGETVTRLRALSFNDTKTDTTDTQKTLERQLQAAERAQEKMKELSSSDDVKRFAEFSQEAH